MAKQYFKAVSILSLLAMVLAFVPAAHCGWTFLP
jgi:hypothetical protein